MRAGWLLAIATLTADAAAEPPRAARPSSVALGVSLRWPTALPFVDVRASHALDPHVAVTGAVGFFSSDDRVFGPRLYVQPGLRWYPTTAAVAPFLGAHAAYYHEFDVDYSYSDASQRASTSVGGGLSAGLEATWPNGAMAQVQVVGERLRTGDVNGVAGERWEVGAAGGWRF